MSPRLAILGALCFLLPQMALAGCGRGFDTIAQGAAPDVQRLDGTAVPFAELTASDKPTLLVYSTIWCERCRKERPHVEAWAQTHAARVKVISIVSGSPVPKVLAANKRYGITIEHAPMVVDASGALAEHHGIHATPTLILLGADGAEQGRYGSIDKVPAPAGGDAAVQGSTRDTGSARLVASSAGADINVERQGRILGTSFHVVVSVSPDRVKAAAAAIDAGRARVERLDALLSEWRSDSQVSRLNASAAQDVVPIGPELRAILRGAQYVSKLTAGAFDVSWKPLGAMWDEAERLQKWPTRAEIRRRLKLVGADAWVVDKAGARLAKAGARIGVAGVAKGYIIDSWFLSILKAGFTKVIVNIGGDLRTVGALADGSQRSYLIADPYAPGRKFAGRIEVGAAAVATSGNYWRQRTLKGPGGELVEVGHIVDPRTGTPPAFDGSVTVITKDAAMADALATGLFILGPVEGLALARRLKDVDAVFVTRKGLKATVAVLPADDSKAKPRMTL